MATYLTNTEDLTTVANAIRTKGETSEQLSFPNGFAQAISAIPGITPSGTIPITSNGNHDVTNYSSASVNVPASFRFQNRTDRSGSFQETFTYGKDRFVTFKQNRVAYSLNGINWNDTYITSQDYMSVAYGQGLFVAIAYNSNTVSYTSDGLSVTCSENMPATRNWRAICYGGGKFVAVAWGSDKGAYSTDGINWTEMTMPATRNWRAICYGGGKFVAIANGSDKGAYSTDGVNWTEMDISRNSEWVSITYGLGKFIMVAYDELIGMMSTDGINWTMVNVYASTGKSGWCSVAYGNGIFIATRRSQAPGIATYSTDGTNWSEIQMPEKNGGYISYGGGKFIVINRTYNAVQCCDMRVPIT